MLKYRKIGIQHQVVYLNKPVAVYNNMKDAQTHVRTGQPPVVLDKKEPIKATESNVITAKHDEPKPTPKLTKPKKLVNTKIKSKKGK